MSSYNQTNVTNIFTLPTLPCGLKSHHFIIMFDLSSLPTNEDTKNLKSYPSIIMIKQTGRT